MQLFLIKLTVHNRMLFSRCNWNRYNSKDLNKKTKQKNNEYCIQIQG